MTIIKNIINSAKKTWRGEEDPVKVFYTWGLVCYIILPLFTAGLGCLSIVFLRKIINNWGLACYINYIALPLVTSGLSYLSIALLPKIINSCGVIIFALCTPFLMLLLVAPLLTYILCSRNIHNVKAKNTKVKKRIVRILMFDINNILSFMILIALMALNFFGTPLVSRYPLVYFILFVLFIFSNAYRYYKYSLKYQLIFNEKLLNYKVPFTHIGVKYLSLNSIKKTTYKNISSKITINNIKIAVLRILYLPVFITKIILNILYLIVFVFGIIIRITYIPIIITLVLILF
jgi:hypothetical protein